MTDKTRAALIAELQSSQQRVSVLLESMAEVQDWQPEPAEWSFRFIAAHLATVERKCHLHRITRIAAGENPHFDYYLNAAVDFGRHDVRDSLQQWAAVRLQLLDFVASLPLEKLELTGTHDAFGAMTVLDMLAEMVEHDHGHIRHLSQLIEDYREEMLLLSRD